MKEQLLSIVGALVAACGAIAVVIFLLWVSGELSSTAPAAETKESRRDRGAKGLTERDAAGQRCVDRGDVPVMGFGFAVVCIDGASVVEYTKPDYGDEP